ncbi:hypothetical protein PMIN06_005163 [Paraphaeosphaeria minitans]
MWFAKLLLPLKIPRSETLHCRHLTPSSPYLIYTTMQSHLPPPKNSDEVRSLQQSISAANENHQPWTLTFDSMVLNTGSVVEKLNNYIWRCRQCFHAHSPLNFPLHDYAFLSFFL